MTRVSPCLSPADASTADGATSLLVSLGAKVFSFISHRFIKHSIATPSTIDIVENGQATRAAKIDPAAVHQHQQSSTRRLAFGFENAEQAESSKPVNDFYNNSTLTNISKLFCALVLITAFILVMSRSFHFYHDTISNSNSTFSELF